MKLKIKGAVFHCGRCRKDYSNPFGHVCVSRLDKKPPAGKTKLAPKASVSGKCEKCGKPRGLRHTCTVKTDFKKRQAGAKKAAAAKQAHLYEACQDKECQRIPCRAYKEGRQEGYREGYGHGHQDGWHKGWNVGWGAGFPAGINACPRKHG